MIQWMRFLICLLCSTSLSAKRHVLLANLEPDSASADGQTVPDRISDEDEDGDTGCLQEKALKVVLGSLGVREEELQDVRRIKGVAWNGCDVTEINFNYPLHGYLHDQFRELSDLQRLHLDDTNLEGDLAVLKENTKLEWLSLRATRVSGSLKNLQNAESLKHLDVSRTSVSGDLMAVANAKEIQELDVSGTKVQIFGASFLEDFWPMDGQGNWKCPFPMLTSFDVSETPLFTTVEKFLRPFLGCRELETFKAAECNLTGAIPSTVQVDSQGSFRDRMEWPLSQVLRVLDLASNNVTRVEALPAKCLAVILAGNPSIEFETGVLKKAISSKVALDLRNVLFVNTEEANDVLDTGVAKQSNDETVFDQQYGFACFGLSNSLVQISPEKFAPDRLCSCSHGWKGFGVKCEKCPANSFTDEYNSRECHPCPPGSKAPEGSTSFSSCVCDVGFLQATNGVWRCGCPKDEAQHFDLCVHCSDWHLSCPRVGSEAHSSKPLPGYARLDDLAPAFRCLEPDSRCVAEDDSDSPYDFCAKGYKGPMCMDCAPNYFAHGKRCEQCHDATMFSSVKNIAAGITMVLAAIGVGTWLWMRRSTQAEVQNGPGPFSAFSALKEQWKAQAPILLQLCQLWAVLALLLGEVHEEEGTWSAFWEVPYVQTLQLSISSFQSAFNLQCKFDTRMVRFVFALLAPLFPLAVMLCCLLLEFVKPGFGITAGLQALTLLYIGGASSTSSLSSCQEFDGNKVKIPGHSVVRTSMPYIFCHRESNWKTFADRFAVFYTICYGILIPCCLLYLYGKQHFALQEGRTTTVAGQQQGDLTLCLSEVLGSTQKTSQKDQDTRRLVAATAGYISVLYHGRVQVRVAGGTVFVKRLGECRDSELNLEAELLSFIHGDDVKLRERQLKCRSLSEMLMERVILKEIAPNDRIMFGMKHLLVKYSLCRNVWMEIVQKLVAMLLVSVVETEKALQFSLGITLTMAATSAMVQPYAQPQANRLHFYSFMCLALAAASFHYDLAWPARAALAVPFLLTAAQALKPDNSESLALRLWEELEPQMETLQRGEAVEVVAETYNFR